MGRAEELAYPTPANGGNGMAVQTPLAGRAAFEGVSPPPAVDRVGAQRAIADLLVALGVDSSSEHLGETPRRVADAYAEFLTPEPFDVASFPNDQGYDELIVARAIPVRSLCEHHLLPFTGWAHVGYLPDRRILGLSKLARVVELFAGRLQIQERLTCQVADWLEDHVEPKGVGVVVEADHTCMTLRGVRAQGSTTVTSALRGVVRHDGRTRQEFFSVAAVGSGA
jgi:GTP cyclohydrolase I